MNRGFFVGVAFSVLVMVVGAQAKGHAFICADDGLHRVAIFNEQDECVWEVPAKKPYAAQVTAAGNVLLTTGFCVQLVSPAKKLLWEYEPDGQVYGADMLPDGSVIVGECTTGLITHLAADGTKISSFKTTYKTGGHMTMRHIRYTPQNTVLVGHLGDQCVREYELSGTLVHEFIAPSFAYVGIRTAQGHTWVSHKMGVVEFDENHQPVWEMKDTDIPVMQCRWINTIFVRDNGNLLIGNWLGHGFSGKGTALFEVNRAKEVVWTFDDPIELKQITAVSEITQPQLALFGARE